MAVLVRMVLEKISRTFILNYNGAGEKPKAILFFVSYSGRIKLLAGIKGENFSNVLQRKDSTPMVIDSFEESDDVNLSSFCLLPEFVEVMGSYETHAVPLQEIG